MKRIIFIPLFFVIFNSCSFNSTTIKQTPENTQTNFKTISLWHHWTDESSSNILNTKIVEWSKLTGMKVKVEGSNVEQYKTKIRTALASNEAPDIFFLWEGSFVEPYIKQNNLLPLDDLIAKDIKSKIHPSAINSCSYNGKLYGLPTITFIANLYCNKRLFTTANLELPTTFDQLLNCVKVLNSNNISPISVGLKDKWPGMYWYNILSIRQAGSKKCLEALKNPKLFNQPEFKESAQKLLELVKAKAFNENSFLKSYSETDNDFVLGKSAMIFQGTWIESFINNTSIEQDIVSIPFPIVKDGIGNSTEYLGGNSDNFYININTKYKKEAVDSLIYICENTSKYGYKNGMGLSSWKIDESNIQLSSLTKNSFEYLQNGTAFVPWWDTILSSNSGDKHKNLVIDLFSNKITAEKFISEMTNLSP